MAHLTTTPYSAYELTAQEYNEGSKFTINQKQVIQNQIALLADELLLLEPDPNDYAKFIQQQAHTKGGIQSLQYLLALGEATEEAEMQDVDLRPELNELDMPDTSNIFPDHYTDD